MSGVRLGARLWWGLVPLLVLLWGVGALVSASLPGLPVTPVTTLVAVPVLSFAREVAVALVCGALAIHVIARAPQARRWAWGWALASLGFIALNLAALRADVVAASLTGSPTTIDAGSFIATFTGARALVLQAACVTLASLILLVDRRSARIVSLVLALIGASLPAFTGHAGLSGQHSVAAISIALHIASVFVWVGGLATVSVLVLVDRSVAPSLLPRFSTVALVCVIVAGETGLLSASLTSGSLGSLLGTAYGSLVLAKCVLLGWLIRLGWLQRRRVMDGVTEMSAIGSVVRVAGIEFLAMGTALACAVVLSRIGPAAVPGDGFAPLTLVVLGIGAPLVGLTFLPHTWKLSDAYPEAAAVVLLLAMIEVGGVGLLRELVGPLGLMFEAGLLLLFGWIALGAARHSVGGRLVLVIGTPVAVGIATALAGRPGTAQMAVTAVLFAEVALVWPWVGRRAQVEDREPIDVAR